MTEPTYTVLFTRIADYCTLRGWIPVGRREFTVGRFRVRVNGLKEKWEAHGIPPFSATVDDPAEFGLILVNPYRGSVVGRDIEDDVIVALDAAIKTHQGATGTGQATRQPGRVPVSVARPTKES